MRAPREIRARDFDAHAKAPLSEHEWICREEARERFDQKYGPQFAQGPKKQLLDGTWVPDWKANHGS